MARPAADVHAMAESSALTPLLPNTAAAKASRAVLRPIEAGSYVDCASCKQRVKFQAKIRLMQVICNVYDEDRWLRVEHYHEACYLDADSPHGPAI
jgi:hypothetical protein